MIEIRNHLDKVVVFIFILLTLRLYELMLLEQPLTRYISKDSTNNCQGYHPS